MPAHRLGHPLEEDPVVGFVAFRHVVQLDVAVSHRHTRRFVRVDIPVQQ